MKSNTGLKVKKKDKKVVAVCMVKINATFNNTIVAITDLQGNVLFWSSSGAHGFKGSKKSTPFAGQTTAEHVVKIARDHGVKTVSIEVKGPGSGRESALRAVQTAGFQVTTIKDVTPVPHNGCRPKKRRRV